MEARTSLIIYIPHNNCGSIGLPALSVSDMRVADDFMRGFITVPIDAELAKIAAEISRQYKLKIPDAFIAATTLFISGSLATRDKVFRKIYELELVEI